MNRFLAELKRRNVIRVAGLYLAGAWLLVQVTGTVLPFFNAPLSIARTLTIVLAVGFIPALVNGPRKGWSASPRLAMRRRTRRARARASIG